MRRRFFPARPVQQVPGRRVELAVQVRKEGGEATAPAPTPVTPVLSWINTPDEALAAQLLRGDESGEIVFVVRSSDDGLTHIAHEYGGLWTRQPWVTTGWAGTPWRIQADGVPLPMAGPGWHCMWLSSRVSINDGLERLPLSTCYAGVVLGVPPERITWQLEWTSTADGESFIPSVTDWGDAVSPNGHVARAIGCQVLVYPLFYGGSNQDEDRLTATALVDGAAIGALHFVAQRVGW